jgi:hypothetical protein
MGPHVTRSVVQYETWPVCPEIILVQVNTIKHYGTLTIRLVVNMDDFITNFIDVKQQK